MPVVLFNLPAKEGPKKGIVLRAIGNLKKRRAAPLGNKDAIVWMAPKGADCSNFANI